MKAKTFTEIDFLVNFHFIEENLPFNPQNIADIILDSSDYFTSPHFIEDAITVCRELGVDINSFKSIKQGLLGFNFSHEEKAIIGFKSDQEEIAHTIFHELYELLVRSYNKHAVVKVQENEADADTFANILIRKYS